jgi:hypothetical protein
MITLATRRPQMRWPRNSSIDNSCGRGEPSGASDEVPSPGPVELDRMAGMNVDPDDARAARDLAALAVDRVARAAEHDRWRASLRWLSRGRSGRVQGWPARPVLGSPWQDTISAERSGWRERAAYLPARDDDDGDGGYVFGVDYRVCQRCRLGWVEQPYTVPRYQRCGVAAAGLAALRAEHPGVGWHTLGGHFRDSEPFWTVVGAGVPGGYEQRDLCPHVTAG